MYDAFAMNTEHPEDLAPLHYGCGLAIGLMLILGLPRQRPTDVPAKPKTRVSCPADSVVAVPSPAEFTRQSPAGAAQESASRFPLTNSW